MDAGFPGQAVDALGPAAVQPALDVLDHHARIAPGPLEGDRPRGYLDPNRIVRGIGHGSCGLPAGAVQALEWLGRGLHVEDVRDPRAEESLRGLPLLVLPDGLSGHAIDLGIGV